MKCSVWTKTACQRDSERGNWYVWQQRPAQKRLTYVSNYGFPLKSLSTFPFLGSENPNSRQNCNKIAILKFTSLRSAYGLAPLQVGNVCINTTQVWQRRHSSRESIMPWAKSRRLTLGRRYNESLRAAASQSVKLWPDTYLAHAWVLYALLWSSSHSLIYSIFRANFAINAPIFKALFFVLYDWTSLREFTTTQHQASFFAWQITSKKHWIIKTKFRT